MWWILIIIICIGIWINISEIKNKNNKIKKYESNGEGYITEFKNISYIGGFKDLGACTCELEIFFNKIKMTTATIIDAKCILDERIINFNDILDVSIQSDMQIQNQISLGKMIFFGAFAFASPSEKTIINEYVVINLNYNESNINLIFKSIECSTTQFVHIINEARNKFNRYNS
ncbi:hypothetical protein [Clostridium sulfidigenes]|uniref:hypothetical protein n=1 Tax=Clostridium sulfidigenes TaxID=318464 RepID=UPI003F896EEC